MWGCERCCWPMNLKLQAVDSFKLCPTLTFTSALMTLSTRISALNYRTQYYQIIRWPNIFPARAPTSNPIITRSRKSRICRSLSLESCCAKIDLSKKQCSPTSPSSKNVLLLWLKSQAHSISFISHIVCIAGLD